MKKTEKACRETEVPMPTCGNTHMLIEASIGPHRFEERSQATPGEPNKTLPPLPAPPSSRHYRAALTQLVQVLKVLQHHLPVQGPLARAETLPFFPAEVHSHVSEGHWHLTHRWLRDSLRLSDSESERAC